MGATDSFREIDLLCLSVISKTRAKGRCLQSYHSPNFAGKLVAPGSSIESSAEATVRFYFTMAMQILLQYRGISSIFHR
jgi:hypothetical protein